MASKARTYADRAKQFIPFDALKGFRQALAAKERTAVARREMSEDQQQQLDAALRRLRPAMMVTAVHYHDGRYVRTTGLVTGIDAVGRTLTIVRLTIPLDELWELTIEQAG